ncbi:MAG: CRISPR-associated endonuclease Cas1 [Promethearchaeota archaeon]
MLSFAYVIVGAEIQSLLDGAGFDPYLGYYHSIHYGRPSLALDLLEEFRHGFVDRFVLKMFNLQIFSKDDFAKHSSGGVFLNTEGKRKFFTHYEKAAGRISGSESTKTDKKKIRQIFQQQVYKMKDAVINNISYVPWNG